MSGEYNTDGSVSLSLALLRRLFKCVHFASQMVNVSVSNITANRKKKVFEKALARTLLKCWSRNGKGDSGHGQTGEDVGKSRC